MKIVVTNSVLDYDGKALEEGGSALTWRKVFTEALNAMLPGGEYTADEKQKSYEITMKSFQSDDIELSLDERHFLLEKIRKIYNPLVCGRAMELLEGSEVKQAN